MRYLISLIAALLFVCACHARPPQAPPCFPAQAPDCGCAVTGVCDCGPGCQCPNCPAGCSCKEKKSLSQEDQWRSEGWRKDAYGNWYRILPVSANSYEVPMFYFQPRMYSGGGGGGC